MENEYGSVSPRKLEIVTENVSVDVKPIAVGVKEGEGVVTPAEMTLSR